MPITSAEKALRDADNVNSMMGVSDSLGHIENIRTVDGKLIVATQVYDTTTSGWTSQENAWTATDVANLIATVAGTYYDHVRIEYDGSNNPVYIGKNVTLDASVSGTDWVVTKCTYSGIYMTEKETAVGAWSNRGGLF